MLNIWLDIIMGAVAISFVALLVMACVSVGSLLAEPLPRGEKNKKNR